MDVAERKSLASAGNSDSFVTTPTELLLTVLLKAVLDLFQLNYIVNLMKAVCVIYVG
jgi:hypothetical protein